MTATQALPADPYSCWFAFESDLQCTLNPNGSYSRLVALLLNSSVMLPVLVPCRFSIHSRSHSRWLQQSVLLTTSPRLPKVLHHIAMVF